MGGGGLYEDTDRLNIIINKMLTVHDAHAYDVYIYFHFNALLPPSKSPGRIKGQTWPCWWQREFWVMTGVIFLPGCLWRPVFCKVYFFLGISDIKALLLFQMFSRMAATVQSLQLLLFVPLSNCITGVTLAENRFHAWHVWIFFIISVCPFVCACTFLKALHLWPYISLNTRNTVMWY